MLPNKKLLYTAICAVNMISSALYAQNKEITSQQLNSQETTGDAKQLETVSVTGSRLFNPNVVSPQPVSVLTAEDIKATGAVNIGDALTTMPQLATTFTMGNSTRYIGTAGVAMQDLRNLGTSRTLVLVNGRRMVSSSSGTSAVDTNLIPTDWIERVEIITGGASAVYGADAVSGVINFILKKQYEGANFHAQYGSSEHGSFNKGLVAVTGGTNFADDRGNIAASLEHSWQDPLEFRDRFGHASYREILASPGSKYSRILTPNGGGYTRTLGGTFSLGGDFDVSKRYVFDPDGSVRRQRFDGPYDLNGGCADCDRNDASKYTQLQPDYERVTLNTVASFDVQENQRFYFEGLYNKANVETHSSPAFGTYSIRADNAFISPDLAALMDGKTIRVGRLDLDAGRRGENTERKTMRVVIGTEGMFGDDWQYDASINYGRTHERRQNLNNRIVERFNAGLDAVIDPMTGKTVCRSQVDPNTDISPEVAAGCIPFSIFGEGAIEPKAADWFNTTTLTKTQLTQFVAGGSLTNNSLFELAAGPVSFATGLEYRRETSRQRTDPLDQSGATFLNAIPDSSGSYNVKEIWAEGAIPLLHDLPLIKSLTLGAAARYSDYDTVGSTEAWRYNLDWAVNDSLRFRGNMSAAVRAPNIDELFGGQSQNFGFIDDPCASAEISLAKNPEVRRANCAALNIPADHTDTVSETNKGLSGSNPNLSPETGRSWTAGFVLTPASLPGFSLNVDYWKIRLSDAISALSFQQTAERCVDAPSGIGNAFCQNVRRNPTSGQIEYVISINENIAAIETDGVDISASYSHDFLGGKMRWKLDATRTLGYTDYPFQDDPDEGEDYLSALGFPKWKATLGINYARDDWDVSWYTRFASGTVRQDTYDAYRANPYYVQPGKAGSAISHDIRSSYDFDESGWQVYGGITNLFNSDPPVALYGTSLGSAVYETIGRAYFLGINYKFF